MIAQAGKHVESVFDKQIKQLPPPAEAKATVVKKLAIPPLPPPAPAKRASVAPVCRPSTSVQPVIWRNEAEQLSARPKREIHPPAPKDLPYADTPKKMRKAKVPKDDGTAEQLKYYARILNAIKLDIPTYYKVIKMDMSTMRKKLDAGEYPNATKFFEDFKLMIRNCFIFNPSGTPVNQAGIDLPRLFDEKWRHLTPLWDASNDEDEELAEEEQNRRIATMEAQIESMRGNLMALKNKPAKEKKKKEKKEKAPVAFSSKEAASRAPKAAPATNGNKRKTTKKPVAENDALSFEQKKNLSRKVVQITHEGVPEIRDVKHRVEIDVLPPHVLTKLYKFVLRPLQQPTQKRHQTGKGTGTETAEDATA
ncbi:Bromodomain-containing protein, partial [Rhizopogon salebrosus TDB-379]